MVGKISKQFTGIVIEIFTSYSNFDIQFSSDIDVKMKAVILGACFLIVSLFLLNFSIGDFSSIILKLLTKFHILKVILNSQILFKGVTFYPCSDISFYPDTMDS